MVDDSLAGAEANQAVALENGTSVCRGHAGPAAIAPPATASGDADGCVQCRRSGGRHDAWFVLEGSPLCIRHAADEVFPHDDMAAHQMAQDLYLELHARGVRDRY